MNHPIHHLQPGDSKYLRFKASEPYSLIGFVDWVLRAFAEHIWKEMYQDLYLQLTEGGEFERLTKSSSDRPMPISPESYEWVQKMLRRGRADGEDWFKELQKWNQDTGSWAEFAPDITELFRDKNLFEPV